MLLKKERHKAPVLKVNREVDKNMHTHSTLTNATKWFDVMGSPDKKQVPGVACRSPARSRWMPCQQSSQRGARTSQRMWTPFSLTCPQAHTP